MIRRCCDEEGLERFIRRCLIIDRLRRYFDER